MQKQNVQKCAEAVRPTAGPRRGPQRHAWRHEAAAHMRGSPLRRRSRSPRRPNCPGPSSRSSGSRPACWRPFPATTRPQSAIMCTWGRLTARRGVGRACGGQRVRTLCSAPPRPKHCPGRATASGHCDAGGGTCGAQCAVSDVGWLRRTRSRRSRRRSPPDRPVEVVGSRRICSPRVRTSRCRSAAVMHASAVAYMGTGHLTFIAAPAWRQMTLL